MDIEDVLADLEAIAGTMRQCLVDIGALQQQLAVQQQATEDVSEVGVDPITAQDQVAWDAYCHRVEIDELCENALTYITTGINLLVEREGKANLPPLPTGIIDLERVEIEGDSDGGKHYYVCGIFSTAIGNCVIAIESVEVGDDLISIDHDHWAWDEPVPAMYL